MQSIAIFVDRPYQVVREMNRLAEGTGIEYFGYGVAIMGRHFDAVILTGSLDNPVHNDYAEKAAKCRARTKDGVIDLRGEPKIGRRLAVRDGVHRPDVTAAVGEGGVVYDRLWWRFYWRRK